MKLSKQLEHASRRLEALTLPDTCTIETTTGVPVMSPDGIMTTEKIFRIYRGSINIPCRLDNSRSFRPESLPNQEINANEYVLHFPREVTIRQNDKVRVVVDGVTHTFEIRKQSALSNWRVMNEALMVELEGQRD